MKIVPLHFRQACAFVNRHHRHHCVPQGHKLSVGLCVGDRIVGVATCGRPVSRVLDNGSTLEVTRLCTDGTPNACTKLYGACARIAREMGYEKIITYTLDTEPGTTLRAAGWHCEGKAGGINWNAPGRPRKHAGIRQLKMKYSKKLNK